jgi:uncharacterized membrane protein
MQTRKIKLTAKQSLEFTGMAATSAISLLAHYNGYGAFVYLIALPLIIVLYEVITYSKCAISDDDSFGANVMHFFDGFISSATIYMFFYQPFSFFISYWMMELVLNEVYKQANVDKHIMWKAFARYRIVVFSVVFISIIITLVNSNVDYVPPPTSPSVSTFPVS